MVIADVGAGENLFFSPQVSAGVSVRSLHAEVLLGLPGLRPKSLCIPLSCCPHFSTSSSINDSAELSNCYTFNARKISLCSFKGVVVGKTRKK